MRRLVFATGGRSGITYPIVDAMLNALGFMFSPEERSDYGRVVFKSLAMLLARPGDRKSDHIRHHAGETLLRSASFDRIRLAKRVVNLVPWLATKGVVAAPLAYRRIFSAPLKPLTARAREAMLPDVQLWLFSVALISLARTDELGFRRASTFVHRMEKVRLVTAKIRLRSVQSDAFRSLLKAELQS